MIKFNLKKRILLSLAIVLVFIQQIDCQSRCDTICASDLRCSSGQCLLSKCSDRETCFEFCLRCYDVETCYASGATCDFSDGTINLNSSNKNTQSCHFLLSLATVLYTYLLFKSLVYFISNLLKFCSVFIII